MSRGRHWAAIAAQFGFDPAADLAAARVLQPQAGDHWDRLAAILAGRSPCIVACGPALASLTPEDLGPGGEGHPVVAADGATSRLRELDLVPDVVVTDLDGRPEDLEWAAAHDAVMVVHAHGDNLQAMGRLVDRLAGPGQARPLGTCQCDDEGLHPLRDVGGFTDGDRALLLCRAMGAAGATMVAFQPDAPPSRYSHRFDPATKPAKLRWAARIVADTIAEGFAVRIMP